MLASLALLLAIEPHLEAPWACEATYPCTQGNGGATSHTGFAQFAWDFGLPLGTEIKAAHAGTIVLIEMDSQVGGCSQTYANDANYVVIDHGDGTAGLYMHVEGNSSPFGLGDFVEAGDTIARVGLTGWTCGAHLHFQVQGLCGSWWCQSIPSEFYAAGVVADGESMTSENCGACGAVLAGGETLVSESDKTCFDRLTKWWWDAGEGLDGHHWYTYTTDAAQADTIGRWRFGVSVPGDYEVAVHVPEGTAQASGAVYHVHHAGQVSMVGVDQATQKSWQSLGVFGFDGSGDQFVELPDNTGEAYALMHPLAFDSVRFTWAGDGDGDSTTTTTSGEGDSTSSGGSSTEGGECPIGGEGCPCTPGGGCDPDLTCVDGICEPTGESSGASEADSGNLDEADTDCTYPCGPAIDRGDEGCGCTSEPRPASPIAALALLGLLGLRRRHA
ncbi:peptidoglycan DD-metalloendopeptidase family protein [Nannocystaceae bacterium ST9]